jgi:hypothetical protein
MGVFVEIKDEQSKELDRLALQFEKTREALVADAIEIYLNRRDDSMRRAFGLWRDVDIDGVEYQRKLRSEW